MKKILLFLLLLVAFATPLMADVSDETGDNRTVPCTLYGKQSDGTITAFQVDSDGKLVTSGGGGSGSSVWTETVDGAYLDGDITITGLIEAVTLNTGQGANELYDMDQNVLTTSDVTFNNIYSTGDLSTNSNLTVATINGNNEGSYILNSGTRAFAGNQSFGDNNITNVGDVSLDTISADAIQMDIVLADNTDQGLTIREGTNPYMEFITTNNGEQIRMKKDLSITSDLTVDGKFWFTDAEGDGLELNGNGNGIFLNDTDITLSTLLTLTGGVAYYKGTEIGTGGGGGATTDGGDVTYVTSETDDFAIGGTDSTASIFFDESAGDAILSGQLTLGGNNVINATSPDNLELQVQGTLVETLTETGVIVANDLTVNGVIFYGDDPFGYSYLTLSGNQTSVSAGTTISFEEASGNLAVSSNIVTLKGGHTYSLLACIVAGGASSGYNYPRWYDSTNGGYIGNDSAGVSATSTTNIVPSALCYAVVSPATDTDYCVKCSSVSNLTTIYASSSFAEVRQMD